MKSNKGKKSSQAIVSEALSVQRNTSDGPFLWVSKSALHLIRDTFDGKNKTCSAIAVYTALCELASDAQNQSFDAKIATIAARSGLSYRTVTGVLQTLESIRLIHRDRNFVEGSKELAPNTYVLLRHSKNERLGKDFLTLGTGDVECSLPRSVEESPEENPKETYTFSPPDTAHHSDEWRGEYSDRELEIIDLYNQICGPAGFLPIDQYSEALSDYLGRLDDIDDDEWREHFTRAAGERVSGQNYTGRFQNKLIRTLETLL